MEITVKQYSETPHHCSLDYNPMVTVDNKEWSHVQFVHTNKNGQEKIALLPSVLNSIHCSLRNAVALFPTNQQNVVAAYLSFEIAQKPLNKATCNRRFFGFPLKVPGATLINADYFDLKREHARRMKKN